MIEQTAKQCDDIEMTPDDEIIDRIFGEWLKEQREKKDLKISVVAKKSGMTAFRLGQLEAGSALRGINTKECYAIAKTLKLNPEAVIKIASGVFRNVGADTDKPN